MEPRQPETKVVASGRARVTPLEQDLMPSAGEPTPCNGMTLESLSFTFPVDQSLVISPAMYHNRKHGAPLKLGGPRQRVRPSSILTVTVLSSTQPCAATGLVACGIVQASLAKRRAALNVPATRHARHSCERMVPRWHKLTGKCSMLRFINTRARP